MTVNERLFEAGLLAKYDEAQAANDLDAINEVLAKVGLQQDTNGMNAPIESEAKPDRKTLNLRSPSEQDDAAPTLNKKGRGWKISETRLDVLHDRAREMKRHSSEAHKALAERFAMADFGRHKFTRHAVVGSAIVDFNCHTLGLAIAIDEDDTPEALATRRDKSLQAVGIRVMHIPAADILADLDAVTAAIGDAMRKRIAEKQSVRRERR